MHFAGFWRAPMAMMTVLLVQSEDKWTEMKLGELLTLGFGPKNLA